MNAVQYKYLYPLDQSSQDTTILCEKVPEINPEKDADRMDKLLKQRALVRLANTSVLKKDVEAFR